MTAHPLCLSRSQLAILHDAAARVLPPCRQRFLSAVADQLQGFDRLDDSAVTMVCPRVNSKAVNRCDSKTIALRCST
jgi:hypothetical protein